jgi:preprotein translocase subunit Sss1
MDNPVEATPGPVVPRETPKATPEDLVGKKYRKFLRLIKKPRTFSEIVRRVGEGEPLKELCKEMGTSHGWVLAWMMSDVEKWKEFQKALKVAAFGLISEVVPLADGATNVPKASLQIKTRFDLAKFHAPEAYGEKETGGGGITVIVNRGVGEVEINGRTLTVDDS